ncbi:MAG TPA: asparagine synthase-related protein [Trebonia sp.]|jgi:hypothetical protein|nr:asparagine synthase-related protein [Trebonia sp.]
MFFTLAVSASTADECAALTERARVTDPRIMPVPGPAEVTWRSPDGRAAILRWGRVSEPFAAGGAAAATSSPPSTSPPSTSPPSSSPASSSPARDSPAVASYGGTIWTDTEISGGTRPPVYAKTSITRVDPVYVAEIPGAVVLSDRAMWAAAVADRMGEHDPDHACALLNTGFPLGTSTPFKGVSALPPAASAHLLSGQLTVVRGDLNSSGLSREATAADVASALVAAVAPLAEAGEPVELSLTGGKDSRLIVAALVAAGVPVHAKTHGFPAHPDVTVAAEVARRLGIEHRVLTPTEPSQRTDVAARLRAAVLVADGMLSAFENVGRPDPSAAPALTAGGHGGELLRGGYAEVAAGRRAARLRAAEVLRRLTTKHAGLLRRGTAAAYLAGLTPWTGTAISRGPLAMLDDFYLVNRAGRWSAAARQAYLIRERLVQPLFDEHVVRAARAIPLGLRTDGTLSRTVLTELSPVLADLPYAGKPAKGSLPVTFDWRRQYGEEVAAFFRDYILDLGAAGGLFDVVSRSAAEKLLTPQHPDRATVWVLATLSCLLSGDYRNAREPSPVLSVS